MSSVVTRRLEPGCLSRCSYEVDLLGQKRLSVALHLPRILVEPALVDIDVSEFDGRSGSVTCTG